MVKFFQSFVAVFFASLFAIPTAFFIIVFTFVLGSTQLKTLPLYGESFSDKTCVVKLSLTGVSELTSSWRRAFEPISFLELKKGLELMKSSDEVCGLFVELSHFSTGWASALATKKLLLDFKTQSKKPIFIYSPYYMTEKGYLVAGSGDSIIAAPSSGFELNGLSSGAVFIKELLEKINIKMQVFRVGDFKSATEMFTETKMSPESKLQTKNLIEDIWGQFKKNVSESSFSVNDQSLEDLAKSLSVQTAEDALKGKLLSNVLSYSEALLEFEKYLKKPGATKNMRSFLKFLNQSTSHLSGSEFIKNEQDKIAILRLEGEIVDGLSYEEGMISSGQTIRLIRKIAKDKSIKALVLRVNSPGGSALAAASIWKELGLLKIPIVASFGDVAASGGYYISAGAKYIVAEPSTIVGSIGIFGIIPNFKTLLNQTLGVQTESTNTHKYSDFFNTSRPMTTYEKLVIQRVLNTEFSKFKKVVTQGRKFTPEHIQKIATGQVWTGQAARTLRLVDQLGGEKEAIDYAANLAQIKDYETAYYPTEKTLFETVMLSLNQEIWSPDILKSLSKSWRELHILEGLNIRFLKHYESKRGLKDRILARKPWLLNID